MTEKTENRIWRGLFLAAIVGVGIAATSQTAKPKAVAMTTDENNVVSSVLYEDGVIYGIEVHHGSWTEMKSPRPWPRGEHPTSQIEEGRPDVLHVRMKVLLCRCQLGVTGEEPDLIEGGS
jgi:hypothetical protein